jgi:hypothetical protein
MLNCKALLDPKSGRLPAPGWGPWLGQLPRCPNVSGIAYPCMLQGAPTSFPTSHRNGGVGWHGSGLSMSQLSSSLNKLFEQGEYYAESTRLNAIWRRRRWEEPTSTERSCRAGAERTPTYPAIPTLRARNHCFTIIPYLQ